MQSHVTDFAFDRAPGGGSLLGSSDTTVVGDCSDGQAMDPTVKGKGTIHTKEMWTKFTVCAYH